MYLPVLSTRLDLPLTELRRTRGEERVLKELDAQKPPSFQDDLVGMVDKLAPKVRDEKVPYQAGARQEVA